LHEGPPTPCAASAIWRRRLGQDNTAALRALAPCRRVQINRRAVDAAKIGCCRFSRGNQPRCRIANLGAQCALEVSAMHAAKQKATPWGPRPGTWPASCRRMVRGAPQTRRRLDTVMARRLIPTSGEVLGAEERCISSSDDGNAGWLSQATAIGDMFPRLLERWPRAPASAKAAITLRCFVGNAAIRASCRAETLQASAGWRSREEMAAS
jgi:hypothetical protein